MWKMCGEWLSSTWVLAFEVDIIRAHRACGSPKGSPGVKRWERGPPRSLLATGSGSPQSIINLLVHYMQVVVFPRITCLESWIIVD